MNDLEKIRQIIEGLLLAAGKPLTLDKIASLFTEEELPEREVLKAALEEIEKSCEGRGFELKKVASGYRFQVRQELSDWVGRLWEERPQRYSRALLETIAIIAYRQPITRGDIEKIRGVAVSSSIVRTLLERDWVRVVGHRDVPGRPAMYASTREFLDYFNLQNLDELPALTEIRDMEDLNQELTLDEEKPEGKVIEFPSTVEDDEVAVADEEELAAAAIGTRSIDEILGIKQEPEDGEEGQDEAFEEPEGIENETAEESIVEQGEAVESTDNEDEESLG
ncbi:MAG: SMC-Scp complex subunit ScpB [SAR86 cluster bacterium]|uniref:SMC-Scp complex subunit ScpB n=1 Tax=SAR86 cluster bacterium TaxID=2030880 RepID=A0A2A5CC59_9GAMM|nr:SMC-Scp complex subunit ScpB [Gammaproteobacteria bacterium AH-315-E17]PCJ41427.1 MAG: SMC-Scp complex subunit ScpB [SAR86 cluster bacterium]